MDSNSSVGDYGYILTIPPRSLIELSSNTARNNPMDRIRSDPIGRDRSDWVRPDRIDRIRSARIGSNPIGSYRIRSIGSDRMRSDQIDRIGFDRIASIGSDRIISEDIGKTSNTEPSESLVGLFPKQSLLYGVLALLLRIGPCLPDLGSTAVASCGLPWPPKAFLLKSLLEGNLAQFPRIHRSLP